MKLLLLLAGLGLVKAVSFKDLFGFRYDCSHCQPEQIHIAYGEKNNDIVVMWVTPQDAKESRVQYGEGTMNMEATGSSKKFESAGGQFIHRVTLKDLKYDTKYVYHCGSKYGWSEKFEFKTPQAGNNITARALIFGDMGVDNARALPYLKNETKRDIYDFIMHVGDIAYDMHEDNGNRGNEFLRQIQPFAATTPYMTVPGNHEYHGENDASIYHYKAKFSMPSFEKQDSLYYSWNFGPVHFVGVNTEAWWEDVKSLDAHFSWVIGDLETASKPENRKQRPWIILYGHRPMYCSNAMDHESECIREKTRIGIDGGKYAMEPLLKKYGVDIVIWAHEHSYERTWPVYDNNVYNGSLEHPYVNPRAPIHIVTGSGGCRENTDDFIKNPEKWSAFRSSDYGYTRFHAYNHTHVYFEQVSVDKKGNVIDSFWVVKEKHAAYDI